MAHIIGAEYLWLARLRHEPATLPVWPELGLDACGDRLAELSHQWPEYLATHPQSLNRPRFIHQLARARLGPARVEEILTHVTIHSAYHRGQIASDLRAAGMDPAYTDYIHAVRQGQVK